MKSRLNLQALVSALVAQQVERGISWREVARQSGVSSPTLTRLRQGKVPDVNTFAALVGWLGVPADAFLEGDAPPAPSVLAPYLGDRPLTAQQAEALAELVKSAYRLFKLVEAKRRAIVKRSA